MNTFRHRKRCASIVTSFSRAFNDSIHNQVIQDQFTKQALPFQQFHAHSESSTLDIFVKLGKITRKDSVIDVGCGPGLISHYLSTYCRDVTGVDLTKKMIEVASASAKEKNIQNAVFLEGNMTNLDSILSNTFNVSCTRYTFHHLEYPLKAMGEMVRVTKPGGRIVVVDATPEKAKQEAYNRFEVLRDPSHTSALTRRELIALGEAFEVKLEGLETLALTVDAQSLIDKAFPEKISREELMQMLTNDIDVNELDFNARRNPGTGRVEVSFPLTAVSWTKLIQ